MRTLSASQPNSFWLINWHILDAFKLNLHWPPVVAKLPLNDHMARDIGLDPSTIEELKAGHRNLIGQHPML